MTHLKVAANSGMKAGLKVYLRMLNRSGLETVQATRDRYGRLSKRAQFKTYCQEFGPKVTKLQNERRQPRASVPAPQEEPVGVIVEAEDVFEDELTALRQRIAEIENERKAAAAAAKPEPQIEREPNVFHPWAVRKHKIPTKVGKTFVYNGKRRKTTFKVIGVENGSVSCVRA